MLPSFPDTSLSLEQQFDLKKFQGQVKEMPRLELETLFIMLLRQKMTHENVSRSLIKEMVERDCSGLSRS